MGCALSNVWPLLGRWEIYLWTKRPLNLTTEFDQGTKGALGSCFGIGKRNGMMDKEPINEGFG